MSVYVYGKEGSQQLEKENKNGREVESRGDERYHSEEQGFNIQAIM